MGNLSGGAFLVALSGIVIAETLEPEFEKAKAELGNRAESDRIKCLLCKMHLRCMQGC